jgi:hypothetical protein
LPALRPFLADVAGARPDLRIRDGDVERDAVGRARLIELARQRGVTGLGVPAFLVGDDLIIGFESAQRTGRHLLALLRTCSTTA